MEQKALRVTKIFFGNFSFPVKIVHFAQRLGLPPEVEVHQNCLCEFEKQIFCPECKNQIEKLVPVSLSTNICPKCHKKVEKAEIKLFCQVCQKEIIAKEVKTVYAFGDKKIEFSKEEREKLGKSLPQTKDIEVITFLLQKDIDPYFGETCYALVPDEKGEIGYAYFCKALNKLDAIALVDVFITKRFYRGIIQPKGERLLLWLMYYENEIDFPEIPKVEIDPSLLGKMFKVVSSSLASEFKPQEHLKNDYLKMFNEIVAQKEAKGEIPVFVRKALPAEVANLTKELGETLSAIYEEQKKKEKKETKEKKSKEEK